MIAFYSISIRRFYSKIKIDWKSINSIPKTKGVFFLRDDKYKHNKVFIIDINRVGLQCEITKSCEHVYSIIVKRILSTRVLLTSKILKLN